MKNIIATIDSLLYTLGIFTNREMGALTRNPREVKDFLAKLALEEIENILAVPMSDAEMMEQFPQFAEFLAIWREVAALMDYRGPVVWLVKHGFTLKQFAPAIWSYSIKLEYMQNWNFDDQPTSDCLVFWIPCLIKNSKIKRIAEMEAHRVELKKLHGLPENHATNFGSIQLLFSLILGHYKYNGDRLPFGLRFAVSDTVCDDNRLVAGYFLSGIDLRCNSWNMVGVDESGFYLLGVEKLGQ